MLLKKYLSEFTLTEWEFCYFDENLLATNYKLIKTNIILIKNK